MEVSNSKQSIQNVGTQKASSEKPKEAPENSEFSALMKSFLVPDAANKVNEEELFAALIHERISTIKGEEAGDKFSEAFESARNSTKREDGRYEIEKSANQALDAMKASGVLSSEEAAKIFSEAFTAAQLDSNTGALYDSYGGDGDSTIATADMGAALTAARLTIEKIGKGEATVVEPETGPVSNPVSKPNPASGNVSPDGFDMDGPEGFLFKPVGDHSKKLVILMPPELTGLIDYVLLKDENGNVVEEGQPSGEGNGGREHFRFYKPGGEYPENLIVEARLENGAVKTWEIPLPENRYD